LTDGDEAVDRLLVEPLLAARALPESAALVVDVGSGGGSPAIPLKLAVPTISLWMVESKVRKSAFLREVVRQLGLDGATVETGRFEAVLERPDFFALVDVLAMRGVRADLKTLASLQRFLKPGGQIFFFTTLGAGMKLMVPPQLELAGEDSLVPALQSSLVRFRKRT
jgi:16S rRNA (guanine527-N7)-methyltransferase